MLVNCMKRHVCGLMVLGGAGLCVCLGAVLGAVFVHARMDLPDPFDGPLPEGAQAWRDWNRRMEEGEAPSSPEIHSLYAFEALAKEVETRFGAPPRELGQIIMEAWDRWEKGGDLEDLLPHPPFSETHADLVGQVRRAVALGGPIDHTDLCEIRIWYEGSSNAYTCRNILELNAHENLLLGNPEEFLKDIEALWALGNAALKQYSLLALGQARLAQNTAIDLIHRACDDGLLSRSERLHIRKAMQSFPTGEDLMKALEFERWIGQRYLHAVRSGQDIAEPYSYFDESVAPRRPPVPSPGRTAKLDALILDSGMAACQAFVRAPYHSILLDSYVFYYDALESLPDFYAVSQTKLAPAFHALSGKAWHDACRNMLLIRLDMMDFREETGRMPVSLKELYAAGMPEFAIDPYSGEPLRYTRDDAGWLIYSVGRNGEDNGGVPPEELPDGFPNWWTGDIIRRLGETG